MVISKAPGRINLIGEHTDYNNGFVLPAAIDRYCTFQLSRNESQSLIRCSALDLGESHSFDLTDLQPIESGWQNYVMGVVSELQKLGAVLRGFDARFSSEIPIGGGMSSSAALECSLAMGLKKLFHLDLDSLSLVKASQLADHNFVGVRSGIMDQFTSMMGKKDHVILLDCQTLRHTYYPCNLGSYRFVLLNTNVSHTLASSEYNTRRAECEEGLKYFQSFDEELTNLRNISPAFLKKSKKAIPDTIWRRCKHVFFENQRVLEACEALQNGDISLLGQLMYQSHYSLRDDYDVSCAELDFLVDLTRNNAQIAGSRMMGGGFGGCTINLVHKNIIDRFVEESASAYQNAFGIQLTPYYVSISDGASNT